MIRMVYNNADQRGDLVRGTGNLETDDGLETAVLASVFTERRCELSELAPGDTARGGWWAIGLNPPSALRGSRMWLLRRAKATQSNVNAARSYIEEALQWLVDERVAKSVEVLARRVGISGLWWEATITRLDDSVWQRAWEAQFNEL